MENNQLMLGVSALCLIAGIFAAAKAVRSPERGTRFGWGAVTVALFGGAGAILLQPVETHAVKIDLLVPEN